MGLKEIVENKWLLGDYNEKEAQFEWDSGWTWEEDAEFE
jgi:hypothetical protein